MFWVLHFVPQDFMVVCRIRKNSEFHLNDNTNRASSSQRPLSTMPNSNCAVSEAGTDQAEKAVECCSKKCSSSYDSYSIEQIDSASESNQKLTSEVTQPECSGHQKVSLFRKKTTLKTILKLLYSFSFFLSSFLFETFNNCKYNYQIIKMQILESRAGLSFLMAVMKQCDYIPSSG